MDRPVVAGVYFVRMGDFVKIGISQDVLSRIDAFATGAPTKLALLGIIPNATRAEEWALHQRFGAHHSNGEWFRATAELLEEASRWGEHVPHPARHRQTLTVAPPKAQPPLPPRATRGPGRPRMDRKNWLMTVRVTDAEKEAIRAALGPRGVARVALDALLVAAGLPPRPDDDGPASEE